jgi:hypothetical protein
MRELEVSGLQRKSYARFELLAASIVRACHHDDRHRRESPMQCGPDQSIGISIRCQENGRTGPVESLHIWAAWLPAWAMPGHVVPKSRDRCGSSSTLRTIGRCSITSTPFRSRPADPTPRCSFSVGLDELPDRREASHVLEVVPAACSSRANCSQIKARPYVPLVPLARWAKRHGYHGIVRFQQGRRVLRLRRRSTGNLGDRVQASGNPDAVARCGQGSLACSFPSFIYTPQRHPLCRRRHTLSPTADISLSARREAVKAAGRTPLHRIMEPIMTRISFDSQDRGRFPSTWRPQSRIS